MKRSVIMTAVLLIALNFDFFNLEAQSSDMMSYQAVIRDAGGNLVRDKQVKIRISILQGAIDGNSVFIEEHLTTTNENGLVSIVIGSGQSGYAETKLKASAPDDQVTLLSGDFSTIKWDEGPYFIKVETDPDGGTNFTITGVSQLLSVPYALYAKNVSNTKFRDGTNADDAVYTKGKVGIGTNTPLGRLDINTEGWNHPLVISHPTLGHTNVIQAGDGLLFKNSHAINDKIAYSFRDSSDKHLMDIVSNGNVGIGINKPVSRLHVNGRIFAENNLVPPKGIINAAIYGKNSYYIGGSGVYGEAISKLGNGVYGKNLSGVGVYGQTLSGYGVFGEAIGEEGVGVYGLTTKSKGVYGRADMGYGVYGEATGKGGIGVYGKSNGSSLAGYFDGDVEIKGNIYLTPEEDHLICLADNTKTLFIGGKSPEVNVPWGIRNESKGYISFVTNTKERLIIKQNGNVGIGQTDPQYKLEVNGQIAVQSIYLTSDVRLKKNIVTIKNALDKVSKLRGVRFQWNNILSNGVKNTEIGLIAQEVEKVIPEVVSNNKEGFKSVEYANLVALLIESVKELKKENEELQQRLYSLENKIDNK